MSATAALKSTPTIYYHVGLGKCASTYLQHDVFPRLTGIHYVHRNRYKRHQKIIPRLNADRILLSRENSQRLAKETAKLAGFYPDAIPIIVIRRHDGWIASQYRRYVKNGGSEPFDRFYDLDSDRGVWATDELNYQAKLEALESNFGRPPIVLNYEHLRADPLRIVDEFCALTGATYDANAVTQSPRHRSWSDPRLAYLRQYNHALFTKDAAAGAGPVRRWLRFRARLLTSYAVMGAASIVRYTPTEPLIPKASLARIRAHFDEDWQRCLTYAERHNPAAVKNVRDSL